MSWLDRIFNREPKKAATGVTGRISSDDGRGSIGSLTRYEGDLNRLAANYPFELFELIENLYRFDPNCKKHLQSTLSLGNPGHDLVIDAATEAQAKEALQICNDLAARCFPFAGGGDGLVNAMLGQTARFGATGTEWEPDAKLQMIERAWIIPIKTIRFRRRPDGSIEIGQLQDGKFMPLNPVQTSFHAVWTEDSSPYPVPPVLASLQRLGSHKRIMASIENWFSKLAAMGFLSIKFDRPEQEMGETAASYRQRSQVIANDLAKSVKENLDSAIIVGFDDMEATFNNTNAGAAGAKQVAQMIDEDLFAGLGRDPVMFGRSFSRTETWSKVAFEELTAEIKNIQQGAKRSFEHGHRLNLALHGFGDIGISIRFKLPRSLDAFRDAEAELMRNNGTREDFKSGICDLPEARKKLGYEDQKAKSGEFIASFSQNTYTLKKFKTKQWIGFNTADQGLAQFLEHVDNSAREARKAARDYVYQIQGQLSDAAKLGVDAVYEWASVREIPEVDTFVAQALRLFLSGAEDTLDARTLERIGREHLDKIWTWARYEDDSVFGGEWQRSAPGKAVTGTWDTTAIGYMSRVDRFYTSKYVSGDDRTNQQITDFLREQYLEKGLGRGKSPKELAAFREEFSELAEKIGEHRARVIIDTGVSRAQNWGQMLALHDEQITTFRIAGPWDRLTCDWCNAMRGKEFTVSKEITRIERVIESGDEDISKFDKFITSRFAGQEGLRILETMDAADVQATGMVTAPIHPLCRHRVVAVVKTASNRIYLAFFEPPSLVGAYGYERAA
jgi:hypothetical protein